MNWKGKVSKKVMEDATLSVGAKCLYALLCCYADHHTGVCYPSVNELRLKMGYTDRTAVTRQMRELMRRGVITRIKKSGKNTVTMINDW